jgi:uncharacterized damage-inducible protein DinB
MPATQRRNSRRPKTTRAANESQRIADQLKRAWSGEAWHGPSVTKILSGVDARTAAARPLPGVHSIWDLALHITNWDTVVRRRIAGDVFAVSAEEDWPPVPEPATPAEWRKTLHGLQTAHTRLLAAVRSFPQQGLGERVRGKNYNFYVMLHGIVQHDLYHAGQIALLKSALNK